MDKDLKEKVYKALNIQIPYEDSGYRIEDYGDVVVIDIIEKHSPIHSAITDSYGITVYSVPIDEHILHLANNMFGLNGKDVIFSKFRLNIRKNDNGFFDIFASDMFNNKWSYGKELYLGYLFFYNGVIMYKSYDRPKFSDEHPIDDYHFEVIGVVNYSIYDDINLNLKTILRILEGRKISSIFNALEMRYKMNIKNEDKQKKDF